MAAPDVGQLIPLSGIKFKPLAGYDPTRSTDGWYYAPKLSNRAVEFFPSMLTHVKASRFTRARTPFTLQPQHQPVRFSPETLRRRVRTRASHDPGFDRFGIRAGIEQRGREGRQTRVLELQIAFFKKRTRIEALRGVFRG